MHKKGKLDDAARGEYLVGVKLPPESGLRCDKMQIFFNKLNPADFPGKLHVHEKMDEVVIVLKGKFTVEMDGERLELREQEYVFKAAGLPGRALAADSGTEVLIIKAPSVENDAKIID
ncbi:MAG: cupin domain-containing protein [Candidatus Pacebacteria bacterium]|jgi:uncharacterized cupin superfamily protein|nr:cupin domain-containing protein [Candidatus Paceibacterota bacterium]